MNKKLFFSLILISFLSLPELAVAQKYWVKFKDKNGTPYGVSNPGAFLSPKSIARRASQGIAVDITDLPVNPSYVSQVDAVSGVTVLARSKWLNGIVISATSTVALTTINSFSFVQSSAPVDRYKVTFPIIEKDPILNSHLTNKNNSTGGYVYGQSYNQAHMIKADCMHQAGYRGQGITIAVLDAGFQGVDTYNVFDSLLLQGRVKGTYDFISNNTMVYDDHAHGTMVLSCMAGIKSGSDTIMGTAPKADYWLFRTEDGATETPSEEYYWVRGAEFADSVGVDITTTSLGYTTFDNATYDHTYASLNGKTAPMSIAATMASRKGIIVLNAAGNEGTGAWNFISVPGDADSIITVGSVGKNGSKSSFSGFGPTSDGRIKPDLCAQGGPAWVCSSGFCFYGSGTSFATPVLAGGVACLLQFKKFAKPMQIINALKASASNSLSPNNSIGWGIPNICVASGSPLLGLSEFAKSSEINIYPNPFSTSLNFEFNTGSNKKIEIKLYDILGKVVFEKEYLHLNSHFTIGEFENFKAGIYFVTVNSESINIRKKIVKQ